MSEVSGKSEVYEFPKPEVDEYKKINPESDMSSQEAKQYWDDFFNDTSKEENELGESEADESDNKEKNIEQTLDDYFKDLKEKSDCPDTIPDKSFEDSDLEKRTPEENAEMRDEFDDKKADLKKKWEEVNGRLWPKYEEDIYSSNGKLIRKAGSDYDAHHIQPLGMGGENKASNITPLHVEVHYDKQGVHAPDSPYSKLAQMLGGMD